jgi:hypothetical protein
MLKIFAVTGATIGGIALIIAGGFALQALDLGFYAFWAPKYKAVERQVFEESKPYVQGKITYLNRLRGQYEVADESQRPALKAVIKREASQIKTEYLPSDLRAFLGDIN